MKSKEISLLPLFFPRKLKNRRKRNRSNQEKKKRKRGHRADLAPSFLGTSFAAGGFNF
jgi:hypothetical protein